MEKITINRHTPSLNQNNNMVKMVLLNKDRESVSPTNILCKDYFQELFAYLLHSKYEGQSQYGLKIDKERYESLKNQDYYEIALKHKDNYIVTDELLFENVARFKNFCDFLSGDSLISSNFEVFRLPAQNNKIWTVLRINKEILEYTFIPSMLLLFLRHFLIFSEEFDFITDKNFKTTESVSKVTVSNIKKRFKILWMFKEHYSFKNSGDISSCHNYSGIQHLSESIKLPPNYFQVLVYGTLRKGFGNHRLLTDSIYIDTFELDACSDFKGIMKMYCLGGFPGLIFEKFQSYSHAAELKQKNNGKKITVEKYIVDIKTMKRLDQLEGYNEVSPTLGLYNKVQVSEGLIYTYNGAVDESKYIEHGDYKKYINEKTFSTTS